MRKLWSLIQFIVLAQAVLAAEPAMLLFSAPGTALPQDQDLRAAEVILHPGAEAPVQRHGTPVYVYVLEGTVELRMAGGETRRLTAGQVFTEMADGADTVMRNTSATDTAKFVTFSSTPG